MQVRLQTIILHYSVAERHSITVWHMAYSIAGMQVAPDMTNKELNE